MQLDLLFYVTLTMQSTLSTGGYQPTETKETSLGRATYNWMI